MMNWTEMLENLRMRVQEIVTDPGAHWASRYESDLAALAAFYVGCCCVVALLTHILRDTVLERVAICAVALGAFSRAVYIFSHGEVPLDSAWLCYSLAFYCTVLIWKHVWVIPRRPDYKPSCQMPKY